MYTEILKQFDNMYFKRSVRLTNQIKIEKELINRKSLLKVSLDC